MTDGTGLIKPPADPNYSHRFPAEIVSHAVWLYHVFNLSLRNAALLWAGEALWLPTGDAPKSLRAHGVATCVMKCYATALVHERRHLMNAT